jgi:glycosyltransferase involved in cell wall biosynthesis
MPNVVLEAMACGLPVIVSDIMGHQELVEKGQGGVLVEVENPAKLKHQMLHAVNQTREVDPISMSVSESSTVCRSWSSIADGLIHIPTYRRFYHGY